MPRVLSGEDLPANHASALAPQKIWLVDRAALPEDYRD